MSHFPECGDGLTSKELAEIVTFFDVLYQTDCDAPGVCEECRGNSACVHCDGGTVFSDQDFECLDDGESCGHCSGSGDCATCDGHGVTPVTAHRQHPADQFTVRLIRAALDQRESRRAQMRLRGWESYVGQRGELLVPIATVNDLLHGGSRK